MNALNCVFLAAQQLSISFSSQNQQYFKELPDTRSQNKTTCHEETAILILNTITIDNPKVITSQCAPTKTKGSKVA